MKDETRNEALKHFEAFRKGGAGIEGLEAREEAAGRMITAWLRATAARAEADMAEGSDLAGTLQGWQAALTKAGITVEEAEALAWALACCEENGRGAEKARNIGLLAGLLDRAAHCCYYSREIAEACGFMELLAEAAIGAEGKGGEA